MAIYWGSGRREPEQGRWDYTDDRLRTSTRGRASDLHIRAGGQGQLVSHDLGAEGGHGSSSSFLGIIIQLRQLEQIRGRTLIRAQSLGGNIRPIDGVAMGVSLNTYPSRQWVCMDTANREWIRVC